MVEEPDALRFGFASPDGTEYSEEYAPSHIFVVLNKRVGSFEKGQLVKTQYFTDRFIHAVVDDTPLCFAYSSADLPPYLLDKPDPYTIFLEGALKKEVENGSRWHSRYFMLKSSKLSWASSKDDIMHPKTVLKLLDTEISRCSAVRFSLSVANTQRVWRFEARNREECNAWIRALLMGTIRQPQRR